MNYKTLGIDIGSTTVKIAILDENENLIFADYKRHFANIRETLTELLSAAREAHGDLSVAPMITGSGGLTLAKHLDIPFVQEVYATRIAANELIPGTDCIIELGGEDAKILFLTVSSQSLFLISLVNSWVLYFSHLALYMLYAA